MVPYRTIPTPGAYPLGQICFVTPPTTYCEESQSPLTRDPS